MGLGKSARSRDRLVVVAVAHLSLLVPLERTRGWITSCPVAMLGLSLVVERRVLAWSVSSCLCLGMVRRGVKEKGDKEGSFGQGLDP